MHNKRKREIGISVFANLDELDDAYKGVRKAVWDFEAQRVMEEKKIVKMTTKAHWDKKLERWTERTIVTHEGGLPSAVDVQTAMDKSKAKMEKTITAMQKDMARIQKELAEATV